MLKQLQMPQLNTPLGSNVTTSTSPISATLQRGLTSAGGKMTIEQMTLASQPRSQAIAIDRAQSALGWMQQLERCKTIKREYIRNPIGSNNSHTIQDVTTYNIPENMTPESVTKGLIELCRPCSPDIVKYFVRLQACKPFFDTEAERIQIIFDCLYDDLREFPEVSVIMGLEDVRKAKGKYWPSMEEITSAVQKHRNDIFEMLDFFKESSCNSNNSA